MWPTRRRTRGAGRGGEGAGPELTSPAACKVWAEVYYPAASLYKAAVATFNFGPTFECAPARPPPRCLPAACPEGSELRSRFPPQGLQDARPMSELPGELLPCCPVATDDADEGGGGGGGGGGMFGDMAGLVGSLSSAAGVPAEAGAAGAAGAAESVEGEEAADGSASETAAEGVSEASETAFGDLTEESITDAANAESVTDGEPGGPASAPAGDGSVLPPAKRQRQDESHLEATDSEEEREGQ